MLWHNNNVILINPFLQSNLMKVKMIYSKWQLVYTMILVMKKKKKKKKKRISKILRNSNLKKSNLV